VAADGKTFVIEDLPAGNFEIQVYGPSKRVEGQPNAVQNSVVGRRPVTLEEGSNVNVPLDEADRVEERESLKWSTSAVRRRNLAAGHRREVGVGAHVSAARPPKTPRMIGRVPFFHRH